MLSVTCNNASANDVMVRTLAKIIAHFLGPANQVCCQAHIVNLVIQIILRQFDAPKKKGEGEHEGDGDSVEDDSKGDDNGDCAVDDNGEGDEDGVEDAVEDVEAVMAEELKKAADHVKPVQKVLSKVCSITLAPLLPPLTHAVDAIIHCSCMLPAL